MRRLQKGRNGRKIIKRGHKGSIKNKSREENTARDNNGWKVKKKKKIN